MSIADFLSKKKQESAEANKKAGEDFLTENQTKAGIIALPSGLQYEILTETEGAKPTATSAVTCHYEGRLLNGTIFDSSIKRNQPATFPLNRVIAGWTEGLQLMAEGSKYRFFIPPHLAYGDRQMGSDIPPNSTLIFDVELLNIA
jgi:FKBP-type peptidyl-prolyl cis-trans isomerase FklB